MEEEEEKKKKKKDVGYSVGRLVRFAKYFANPMIVAIALGILLLIVLIGIWGFLSSIPESTFGWISDKIKSIVTFTSKESKFNVDDNEILDLCKYMEEMGYDLEGSGYVDEITRKNDKTYNDQEFDNNEPTKGEIVSVKSKNLKAYLVAEKKTFVFANLEGGIKRWGREYIASADYENMIANLAAEAAFEEYWGGGAISNTISTMYSQKDGYYYLKEIKELKGSGSDYEKFAKIPVAEMKERLKEMITTYYYYEREANLLQKWLLSNNDVAIARSFGEVFMKLMGADKVNFEGAITTQINALKQQYSIEDLTGEGMIYLEGPDGQKATADEAGKEAKWGAKDGTIYSVKIEEETKDSDGNTIKIDPRMLVETAGDSLLARLGLAKSFQYAYRLNGWLTKYGKPIEFLLAMHEATLAPDFVYQVATSPVVDTKVHVDLFPIELDLTLLTGDGTELKTAIEEAQKNPEILGKYKAYIGRIIGLMEANQPVFPWLFGPIRPNEEIIEEAEKRLRNATTIQDFWRELRLAESYGGAGLSSLIEELENEPLITIEGIEGEYSYKEIFGGAGSVESVREEYESEPAKTAIPYIAKVVNHWYRNQYFAGEETTLSQKKQRLARMLSSIYSMLDAEEEYRKDEEELSAIESETEITSFLENGLSKWVGMAETEEMAKEIQNEVQAVKDEFDQELAGIAYRVDANPPPSLYVMEELMNQGAKGPTIGNGQEVFKQLLLQEQKNAELVQIHNPRFEDNSQYIRNWLKEEYYIFDGKTYNKEAGETYQTLNTDKIAQGKQYIQGKTALEKITQMLEQCQDDRKELSRMLRDVKELFEDYEFELENVEAPVEKVLDNIMPDYVPYTPWPSAYEKSESNCTKMIYKSSSSQLQVPANAYITRSGKTKDGKDFVELEFADNDEQTNLIAGMTLYIEAEEGNMTIGAQEKQLLKRGTYLGTANAQNGKIILKLRLFSMTKQILKVENYMTVKSRTYEDLTSNEKILLYNLQEAELDIKKTGLFDLFGKEEEESVAQREALMNVVLNKIASPYLKYRNIEEILGDKEEAKEANFLKFAKLTQLNTNLSKLEEEKMAKSAISNALYGLDVTKRSTLIGATSYYAITDDYLNKVGKTEEEKKEIQKEVEDLRIKMEIGDRVFGVTDEEYGAYLGDMLNKKLDEIIYELNIDKYVRGFEEFAEELEHYKNAKEQILDYYLNEKGYLTECSGNIEIPEGDEIVTEVTKSNVSETVADKGEGSKEITDTFTLVVNSNYAVVWTFTYTKGAEGKIVSDIAVKHEAIRDPWY